MNLSPDQTIFWQHGFFQLNLTIVTTWILMLLLVITSRLVTRKLKSSFHISKWQSMLEIIVTGMNDQIKVIGLNKPEKFIGFIGTLFLFILLSNICIIFPWYQPPTGSLSTTVALAICVFLAVPFFGISETGLWGYLKSYVQPTPIMLPFNIIGEFSRTLALAVRLFGNIMSGGMIVSILLSIVPFIFPVAMTILGLIIGTVQAYIFSVLATVYIAAATQKTIKVKSNNNK